MCKCVALGIGQPGWLFPQGPPPDFKTPPVLKLLTSEAVKGTFTKLVPSATPLIGISLRGNNLSALQVLDRVLQYGPSLGTGSFIQGVRSCCGLVGALGGRGIGLQGD